MNLSRRDGVQQFQGFPGTGCIVHLVAGNGITKSHVENPSLRAAMALGSLSVILNSLRLRRFQA